jgi:hypothetical protein
MDSKGKSAVECDAISGERRQHRRYLLEMELRWKLIRRRRVLETGIGHTIDLSSGGILFNAGRPLPAGHNVELSISWPVLLNDAVPLQLAAKGGSCATTVAKWLFRQWNANSYRCRNL